MAVKKYVYKFSEGNGSMRELLGGKGANLAEMSRLGMPVPEGYTITTEACIQYYEDGEKISPVIQKQIDQYTAWLQKTTGKKFGDKKNPLLVSVRSGARASMPGMMDTILNLGMNDEVVKAVEEKSGNKRFAYDSYRRFVMMFGDVVMGLDKAKFEEMIDAIKAKKGVKDDIDLDADDMVELTKQFKAFYKKSLKQDFPQDPKVQLNEAIKAVFRSWNNERAIFYRKQNDIPDSWGTAVSVVTMVFGNMGNDCATGVCFSRNPATGDNKYFYGEYLINAQGEDVVSGARTPQEISKKGSQEWAKGRGISEAERKAKYPSLEESMPKVFKQLTDIKNRLEKHYHDMQDMEFTIQEGKLYMLQCRNGKRTANAALKIAVDMVKEGLATKDQALMMVDPKQLDNLLHPTFDTADLKAKSDKIITKGLAAAPGAGTGSIVFSAEDAEAADKEGKKVVLVRLETSPEDIKGMAASQAIVTVRGGMTSHAAVVARGMGACCVSGCGDIHMDEEHKKFTIGDKTFKEGDVISVDGNTGCIYEGEVKSAPAKISGNFATFMKWADERRTMQIRTNADTPADAQRAVEFGAEGVGLVRTEHMFFNSKERIEAIRSFCVAQTPEQRQTALKLMEPYQEEDFYGIFDALGGRPVTVRLLDPPLHEFLPKTKDEAEAIAKKLGITLADVEEADTKLKEFNPMMGHRGCRLDVTYPELGEMQTRAIIKAAIKINKKHPRWHFEPEIMVPLVGEKKELDFVADIIRKAADDEIAKEKAKLTYHIGTMIEVPRGAINAGELAKTAEFFSFGTNDLTQMTMGFSRDDAGKFLNSYYEHHIYDDDPFAHIDVNGVGKLVRWAAEQGRATRPNIHLGVCGEHGGDPKSIHFFQTLGLNYVSCSPFRVPLARLAAAQAAIEVDGEKKTAKKAPTKNSAAKKTTARKAASKPAAKKAAPKKAAVKKAPAKKTATKKTPVKKAAVKKPAAKKTAKKTSRKK